MAEDKWETCKDRIKGVLDKLDSESSKSKSSEELEREARRIKKL